MMKNNLILKSFLVAMFGITACNNDKTGENTAETDKMTAKTNEQNTMATKSVEEKPKEQKKLTAEELKKYKPNELGLIMVLEYHSIDKPEARWTRTPDNFRKDLELLYSRGYYLTPLRDFINNTMDVPAGKSPVILTFDDSRPDQFRYLKDGSIDPNCAVGVLEEVTKKYPDFGKAGTFFVMPDVAFGQTKADAKKKFEFLINNGYEVGNHTVSHPMLTNMSDDKVIKEIGGNVAGVQKILPGYEVNTLAYPFGGVPKNIKTVESGEYKGVKYKNIGALLVGSEPSYSPSSKKFKPMFIPRIQAIQSEFDRHYGLFKSVPLYRYISDGNKDTITFPNNLPEGFKDSLKDSLKNSNKVVKY